MPLITEESSKKFEHHWKKLLQDKQQVTFECETKLRWQHRNLTTGEVLEGPRWLLISAFPEFEEDGTLKSAWGCNVDVR